MIHDHGSDCATSVTVWRRNKEKIGIITEQRNHHFDHFNNICTFYPPYITQLNCLCYHQRLGSVKNSVSIFPAKITTLFVIFQFRSECLGFSSLNWKLYLSTDSLRFTCEFPLNHQEMDFLKQYRDDDDSETDDSQNEQNNSTEPSTQLVKMHVKSNPDVKVNDSVWAPDEWALIRF